MIDAKMFSSAWVWVNVNLCLEEIKLPFFLSMTFLSCELNIPWDNLNLAGRGDREKLAALTHMRGYIWCIIIPLEYPPCQERCAIFLHTLLCPGCLHIEGREDREKLASLAHTRG